MIGKRRGEGKGAVWAQKEAALAKHLLRGAGATGCRGGRRGAAAAAAGMQRRGAMK